VVLQVRDPVGVAALQQHRAEHEQGPLGAAAAQPEAAVHDVVGDGHDGHEDPEHHQRRGPPPARPDGRGEDQDPGVRAGQR
jgi:hypothetical protein